jgi:hypothetical protein
MGRPSRSVVPVSAGPHGCWAGAPAPGPDASLRSLSSPQRPPSAAPAITRLVIGSCSHGPALGRRAGPRAGALSRHGIVHRTRVEALNTTATALTPAGEPA